MSEENLIEPTPHDEDPPGVVTPVDTPYGPNRPITIPENHTRQPERNPAIIQATGPTQDPATPAQTKPSQSQTTSSTTHELEGVKTITLGTLLFWLAAFGAIVGTILYFLLPNIRTISAHFFPNSNSAATQTQNANQTPNPTGTNSDTPKTAFIHDRGYYKRDQTYSGPELLAERIEYVKKNVIWITGDPNHEPILAVLAKYKQKTGIPIYILTGKETTNSQIQKAHQYGFPVYQIEQELETPYSFLLLDDKLWIDVSREHWVWETNEKSIIQNTAKWAQELLQHAQITTGNQSIRK